MMREPAMRAALDNLRGAMNRERIEAESDDDCGPYDEDTLYGKE